MISGQLFTASHEWTLPGSYIIKVTATDGELDSTAELEIIIEDVSKPEENNFILIILALLAFMFLLLFLLLGKKSKKDDKEKK